MKKRINQIRQEPAKIRIGKKGITEGILQEIEVLLKREQFIKIKCLKIVPTESTKAIAQNIANITGCKILDIRGKTFILGK